jgi:hypothetical protein
MKTYGGSEGIALPFLTSIPIGGDRSASRPCCFTPGDRAPGSHWIGGWVGPGAGMDAMENKNITCSCQELNLGHPARSIVAIPAEISLLPIYYQIGFKSFCFKYIYAISNVIISVLFWYLRTPR